jgi:hypothetical protein
MISKTISKEAWEMAARDLGVEVAAIKAVAAVESRSNGFLTDGRPVILFERHIFHKLTNGKYKSDISNPKPGGYLGGAEEYNRLEKALNLDPKAAMMSASWGKFQIMGFNHKLAGFSSVEGFVSAMETSEDAQLDAFVKFLINTKLDAPLRRKDWAAFARGYNGPAYAKNNYDTKMAKEYQKIKSTESIPEVTFYTELQTLLNKYGANLVVDGKWGPASSAALRRFV